MLLDYWLCSDTMQRGKGTKVLSLVVASVRHWLTGCHLVSRAKNYDNIWLFLCMKEATNCDYDNIWLIVCMKEVQNCITKGTIM